MIGAQTATLDGPTPASGRAMTNPPWSAVTREDAEAYAAWLRRFTH